MEHEFYKSGFTSGPRGVPSFFAWGVMLLFSLSQYGSQVPAVNQKTTTPDANASSMASGFQDIKSETGYHDPQRYSKGEPEMLLKWLLMGAGAWCVIVIFLFALFYKSSVDPNWGTRQSEQDDIEV